MFRRQPRAIFRGIFKPNFLLSSSSVKYVVQLLFRGLFSVSPYPTAVIHCWCHAGHQEKFIHHLFLWITAIKVNMLLIVVLGLIAKLALVSSDCDIGTQKLNDFDMNKVGVIILM
jgi:hypothetical protein